jgi:hypothetical protein
MYSSDLRRRRDSRWHSSASRYTESGAKIPSLKIYQNTHPMKESKSPRCHVCIKSTTQVSTVIPRTENNGQPCTNRSSLHPRQKKSPNMELLVVQMRQHLTNILLVPTCQFFSGPAIQNPWQVLCHASSYCTLMTQ